MTFLILLAKRILRPNKVSSIRLLNHVVQHWFGVNKAFSYPVHYTTTIASPQNVVVKGGDKFFSSLEASGGCYFSAFNGIEFGYNVLFAPNVKIISSNHDFTIHRASVESSPVTIGDEVWIGTSAVILPGVSIGRGSVIAAGAVVTKDVKEFTVVAGVPARIIRVIDRDPLECVDAES